MKEVVRDSVLTLYACIFIYIFADRYYTPINDINYNINEIIEYEARFNVLNNKLNNMYRDIINLKHGIQNVPSLYNNISALKDDIQNVSSLYNNISSLKDDIQNVSSLYNNISSLKDDIQNVSSLYNNISALKDDIQNVSSLYNNISALKDDIQNVSSDIINLKHGIQNVSNLYNNISALKDDIQNVSSDIGVLKDDIQNVSSDIGVLKDDIQNVSSLYNNISALKDDIQNVSNLYNNISALKDDTQNVSNLYNNISALKDDIQNVSSDIGVLKYDITNMYTMYNIYDKIKTSHALNISEFDNKINNLSKLYDRLQSHILIFYNNTYGQIKNLNISINDLYNTDNIIADNISTIQNDIYALDLLYYKINKTMYKLYNDSYNYTSITIGELVDDVNDQIKLLVLDIYSINNTVNDNYIKIKTVLVQHDKEILNIAGDISIVNKNIREYNNKYNITAVDNKYNLSIV